MGVTSGTYTLDLAYDNPDYGPITLPSVSCTVSSNGSTHMVISVDSDIFPTPATNGYWYLADAWPGNIKLTAGNTSFITFWWMNEDGSLGFNCTPPGFSAANASADNAFMPL